MRLTTESATSPNIHLRIWNSTNHSSNKPYVTIYYNTNFGAATAFRNYPNRESTFNCWAYALMQEEWIHRAPTDYGTVSSWTNVILSESASYVDNIRQIASPYAAISNTEYRIAFRGSMLGDGACHFIVQLNDGSWAHKMDSNPSYSLGHIDPDVGDYDDTNITGCWCYFEDEDIGIKCTDTLYFAVDPKE